MAKLTDVEQDDQQEEEWKQQIIVERKNRPE